MDPADNNNNINDLFKLQSKNILAVTYEFEIANPVYIYYIINLA